MACAADDQHVVVVVVVAARRCQRRGRDEWRGQRQHGDQLDRHGEVTESSTVSTQIWHGGTPALLWTRRRIVRLSGADRVDARSCHRAMALRPRREWRARLVSLRGRVVPHDSDHALAIAPNLLQQNFACSFPDRVWQADLTYVPTDEGWLYVAAMKDLSTRKIVGWAMREDMQAQLAVDALAMAVMRQQPLPGLILHSDRGSQYA